MSAEVSLHSGLRTHHSCATILVQPFHNISMFIIESSTTRVTVSNATFRFEPLKYLDITVRGCRIGDPRLHLVVARMQPFQDAESITYKQALIIGTMAMSKQFECAILVSAFN